MISQRLRGIKADGEAIEEEGFMPKLQELFSSVGISIQDQNGELRSTFDILNDLAAVWDQLSSKQKQYFGEKVAGNRQVKTLNAIMQNWDVVADTIGKATNAEGEALKGNEMYMESVAGKMTQLKSAFQELATTTISSDFVGVFVDLGTALTKAITSAGGLVPILTTILGIIISIKGVKIAEGLLKIGSAFKGLFTGMTTGMSAAAGWVGAILAIVGVVAAVSSAINSSKKSFQDFQQATADSKSELAKEQGKLEELNGELENTKQLIGDLEGRNLSVIEQDELDRLYEKNNQLENEIALQKQLVEIREREARKAAVEEYKENNNVVLGNKTDWGAYEVLSGELAAGTSQEILLDYAKENIIGFKENVVALNKEFSNVNGDLRDLFAQEGHTYLEDLKESRERAEKEYEEAELIIASRIEYIDSLIGDLERVENPITEADKAFNALFDEREELASLLVDARSVDASAIDKFEMILEKYPDVISRIKEEIGDNKDWEIHLSSDEAVNEINNIIDSLDNLEKAEAKSKTKKFLSDIYMTGEGAGNVDVLNRKVLHGSDMLEKYKEEFEGFEDDVVTYFSSTYGATIADIPIQFTITPIDKDGHVYSQEEVDEYVQKLIDSSGSIEEFKANDKAGKGLLLHYTPVIDGDIESAALQEELYAQLLHSLSSIYDGDTPLQVAIDEMANSVSFDNMVRELESKLSVPREEIEKKLKEMFAVDAGIFDNIKYSVSELGDRLFSSADSKTTKDISDAAKSYKNLTAAMAEQQKAGVLSYETWSKLLSDKGLPGIEKYLSLTANGYALNTDALYDFINAQNEELDLDVTAAIMERQLKIEEYKKAIEDTLDPLKDFQEIEEKQEKIDAWQSEIEQLKAVAMEAHNATGALQQFRDATKTPDQDSEHGEGQNIFETVQKRYEEGKVGTDDYKKGMGFLLGENWQEEYSNDLDKAYKEAQKIGEKYFGKEDSEDAENFAKDLAKKGFATYDEATGQITMLKNESTGAAYTLKEMADAFNMSEDAVESLFGLLNSYSLVDQFEFDSVIGSTEQQEVAMEKLQEKTEELAAAEEELSKIEPGTPEYEEQAKQVEALKEEADEAKNSVDTLNEAIESGGEVNPFESLDQMQTRLTQIQSTIMWLNSNGITTPVELTGQAAQLQMLISGIEKNKNANITVEATDDGATDTIEEVENKVDELNGGKGNATVHIDGDATGYDGTSTSVKDDAEAIGETSYDVQFEATDNETIKTVESAANSVVGDSARIVQYDVGGLDKISGAKELADEVAKPRTIRYGVKFEDGEVKPTEAGEKQDATYSNTTWKDNNGQVHGFSGVHQTKPEQGEISPTYAKLLNEWASAAETSAEASEYAAEKIEENSKTVEQDTESREKEVSYPTQPWQQEPLPNGGVAGGVEGGPSLPDKALGSTKASTISDQWSSEIASMTKSLDEAVEEVSEEEINIPVSIDKEQVKDDVSEISDDEPVLEFPVVPDGLTESVQEVEDAISEVSDKAESIAPNIGKEDIDSLVDAAANLIVLSSDADDAASSVESLNEASVELVRAYSQLGNVNLDDTSAVEAASARFAAATDNYKSAYNSLMEKVKSKQSVNITANTQDAINKINKLSKIKITVNVDANVNTNTPKNAKGTKRAEDGLSLVDEEGAELIEHKSQGTFELGTNNGPRFTQLESGDVVHTASETKRILSRLGSIGGYFRDGLNQAKSIIGNAFRQAGGVDGSTSVKGGAGISSVKNTKKTKKKKKTSTSTSAFEDWAKGLFDWAEVRLERLQTVTNNWLTSAANAIGFIAKNSQLGNAMASVNSQIEATNAAYNTYVQQANQVANQAQLSADIIQKIQSGSIEISSYDDDTQKKIKEYQEWYNKALDCVDALQELHEQQKEIAGERLQNIVDDFGIWSTIYQKVENIHNAEIEYRKSIGKELYGAGEISPYGDYQTGIDNEQAVLNTILNERTSLIAELSSQMQAGYVVQGDENWQKYYTQILSLDEEIRKTRKNIVDLQDAANNLKIEKIGYQLDALTNSASNMNDEMNLAIAQGSKSIDSIVDQYKNLRQNSLQQIDVLEYENAVYKQLQQGLEINSEKYQEYEKAIQDNQKAINSNKQAFEDYHTSLMQLRFDKLKYEMDDIASRAEEINDAMSMRQLVGQTGFENYKLISDYQNLIQNAEYQKDELSSQISLYKEYMQAMVDVYGAEATQSTKYLDMIAKVKELEDSYRGLDESIVGWSKDIQNVKVETVGYKIDEIANAIENYNDKISLMQSNGQFVSAGDYTNMISLAGAQIEKLKEQNQIYTEMQAGMDHYSDAYQELQSKIQSNNSAINDLTISSVGYRDAINQIQLDKYAHQFDLLSASIEKYNDSIKEAEVIGKELTSRFYDNMIRNGEDQVQNLTNQKVAYKALMDSIVRAYGVSAKESDKYKEYEKQYLDLENQIRDTTISIKEWNKAIYDLKTEKIGWQADRTAAAIKRIEDSINLFNAQGRFVNQSNYTSMINESAKQIEYLEKQNALYIEQQRGMDVYSSAYQELEGKIRSNNSAINDLRVSTESYKDAIEQIKLDKYEHSLDNLTASADKYNDTIALLETTGREITAKYYNALINNGNKQIENLEKQKAEYMSLMKTLVSTYGSTAKETEKYKEYEKQVNSLDSSIRDLTMSIVEWGKSIEQLEIDKLSWRLNELTASADRMNGAMSLHNAQGVDETAKAYKDLIQNGMRQIDILEKQNKLYEQQKENMDKNSEAYQNIQDRINSNLSTIENIKVSQEGWNDAIVDLGISNIQKYKDAISKTNDEYKRQKELQESIQELEKIATQRKVRTYIEGQGFVYQSDEEELKNAQEKLEEVVSGQLMDKLDDLIDALEESKKDTNVYDANGNLLGKVYNTPNIGALTDILSSYAEKNMPVLNVNVLKDALGKDFASSIGNTSNNNTTALNIGDIIVNEAKDGNALAQAIVDQFPNALLQALYKK